MRTIYVGFSYPSKFKIGAAAIAFWMKKNYSHVYVRFEYTDSKPTVFHAAHGMVHFRSYENFLKENNEIREYEFLVPDELHDELFDEFMDIAGETYSKMTLLKIFTNDVFSAFFKKNISYSDSTGYICSELVGEICAKRLKIMFSKPFFLLKPIDVDLALDKYFKKQDENDSKRV